MRLSSLSPDVLPATLIDALRTLGIVSDADLFFSATPLEIWRKLPPNSVPLSEFERCVKTVMLQCSVPGFIAAEVDGRPVSNPLEPEIPTGVGDLDQLLGTTLQDSVVEISGRSRSITAVRAPIISLLPAQTFVPRRPSHSSLHVIICPRTQRRPCCGSTRPAIFHRPKRIPSSDQQNHTRSVFRAGFLGGRGVNNG
jgi:hypothetical protein